MDSEQHHASLLKGRSPLNGDLPEILIECQQDPGFCFGEIHQSGIGQPLQSVRAQRRSLPALRHSTNGLGKFSSARRRIYAGMG
jgi:hypothetical protein